VGSGVFAIRWGCDKCFLSLGSAEFFGALFALMGKKGKNRQGK
jgi:hypothetical protein